MPDINVNNQNTDLKQPQEIDTKDKQVGALIKNKYLTDVELTQSQEIGTEYKEEDGFIDDTLTDAGLTQPQEILEEIIPKLYQSNAELTQQLKSKDTELNRVNQLNEQLEIDNKSILNIQEHNKQFDILTNKLENKNYITTSILKSCIKELYDNDNRNLSFSKKTIQILKKKENYHKPSFIIRLILLPFLIVLASPIIIAMDIPRVINETIRDNNFNSSRLAHSSNLKPVKKNLNQNKRQTKTIPILKSNFCTTSKITTRRSGGFRK